MNEPITKKLYMSFCHAFAGVWFCIRNERNYRVHITAAVTVLLVAPYYRLSVERFLLLVMAIVLVIVCEMLNTAIEAAVDLAADGYSALAKKAKDVSAGAVLFSALCAVLYGLFLFWKPAVILTILQDVTSAGPKALLTVCYALVCYLFVRGFDQK